MKTIAALIAGLLLSVVTFLGGLVTATVFFSGGPATQLRPQSMDTAALWTSEPMAVHQERQVLTRVPARPQPAAQTAAAANDAVAADAGRDAAGQVDSVTTGAIDRQRSAEQKDDPGRQQAHVEWCSRRYASYRTADNTYQPYSGARRPCVSPHQDMTVTESAPDRRSSTAQQWPQTAADDGQAQVQRASYDETVSEDSTHIQSCLQRYRSYNVQDNSYQPFDGGPRRQCE